MYIKILMGILLAGLLLTALACGAETVELKVTLPEETAAPAEIAPAQGMLIRTKKQEHSDGEDTIETVLLTADGEDSGEFISLSLPLPDDFPLKTGDIFSGNDAALVLGVTDGHAKNGTIEGILIKRENGSVCAEPVLTIMYCEDRIALMELDASVAQYWWYNEENGLYMAALTEDAIVTAEEAAMLLGSIIEKYSMTLYGQL